MKHLTFGVGESHLHVINENPPQVAPLLQFDQPTISDVQPVAQMPAPLQPQRKKSTPQSHAGKVYQQYNQPWYSVQKRNLHPSRERHQNGQQQILLEGDSTPKLNRGLTWNQPNTKIMITPGQLRESDNKQNTERSEKANKDNMIAHPGHTSVTITDEESLDKFQHYTNLRTDSGPDYQYEENTGLDKIRKDAVLRGAELGGCEIDDQEQFIKEQKRKARKDQKSPFSTHGLPGETAGQMPNEQVAIRNSHLVKQFYDRENNHGGLLKSYRKNQNPQVISSFHSTARALPVKQITQEMNNVNDQLKIAVKSNEERNRRNSAIISPQKLQQDLHDPQKSQSNCSSPKNRHNSQDSDQVKFIKTSEKPYTSGQQQHYQPQRVKITLNCSKAIDTNDYNKLKQMVQDLKNQSNLNMARRKSCQSQQSKRSYQMAHEKLCQTCHDGKGAPLVVTQHPLAKAQFQMSQAAQQKQDASSFSNQPYSNFHNINPLMTPGLAAATNADSEISQYGGGNLPLHGSVTNLVSRPNTSQECNPSNRGNVRNVNKAMLLNLQNQPISMGVPPSDGVSDQLFFGGVHGSTGTLADLQQRRVNTSHSNRRSMSRHTAQARAQNNNTSKPQSGIGGRISISKVSSQGYQPSVQRGAESTRTPYARSQSEVRSSSVWKMRKQEAQAEFRGSFVSNPKLQRPTTSTQQISQSNQKDTSQLDDDEYKRVELLRREDGLIKDIPANQLKDLCDKLKQQSMVSDYYIDSAIENGYNKMGSSRQKNISQYASTNLQAQDATQNINTSKQLRFGVGEEYQSEQLDEEELLTPLLASRLSDLKALISPGVPRPHLGSTLVNQTNAQANFTSQQTQMLEPDVMSIQQINAAQQIIGGHWQQPSAENSILLQINSGREKPQQIQQSPAQKASALRSVPFEDFVNNLRTSQELFKPQNPSNQHLCNPNTNYLSQRSNSVRPAGQQHQYQLRSEVSPEMGSPVSNQNQNSKLTHFHIEAFEDQVQQLSSTVVSKQLNNRRKSQNLKTQTQSLLFNSCQQRQNPKAFANNVTSQLNGIAPTFFQPPTQCLSNQPGTNYTEALLTSEDYKMPVKQKKQNLKKKPSVAALLQPKQFTTSKKVPGFLSCTSEMSGAQNNQIEINEDESQEVVTQVGAKATQELVTLLMTKEVDDSQHDVIKYYTEAVLRDIGPTELQKTYETLFKMIMPVYSGSVDHRVNLFDLKRVKRLLQIENGNQFEPDTRKILRAVVQADERLYQNRQIWQGIWCRDYTKAKGHIPSAVEGASSCTIGNKVYIFGGFARQMFNELREFDSVSQMWSLRFPQLNQNEKQNYSVPEPRSGHTMVPFRKKLYIFGGSGEFLKDIEMRHGFNDLWYFDTSPGKKEWHRVQQEGSFTPKKRMNHCADSMGALMLVSGGYNTETKVTMDDFQLFDFYDQAWISIDTYKPNGDKFQPQAVFINDKNWSKDSTLLNSRRMHQMVAVWDKQFHYSVKNYCSTDLKLLKYKERRQDRLMWTTKRPDIPYREGFYIFGGMDENNQLQNDLFLVHPDHERNKAYILRANGDYVKENAKLAVVVEKITKFHGEPPCPRMHFGMTHLSNARTGVQMLVIYGGRNDAIYDLTHNVALNDVCLFNLNTSTWETLALFGQMPISRWSHILTPLNGDTKDDQTGFMILGGVTNQTYCKSNIYNFKVFEPNAKGSGSSSNANDPTNLLSSPDLANIQSQAVAERKRQAIMLQNLKDQKSLKQCGIEERPLLNTFHTVMQAEIKQRILAIRAINLDDTQSDVNQMSTSNLSVMSQR